MKAGSDGSANDGGSTGACPAGGDLSSGVLPSGVLSPAVLSPGLAAGADGLGPAFELKFVLAADQAAEVEAWAGRHLAPDQHGRDGRYRVTSVYCDTPGLDVFHRSPGFRRTKFRVRRYDAADRVFLERKRKRGDRVRKERTGVHADELAHLAAAAHPADWTGAWFGRRVRQRGLRPTCCVTYRRAAFFAMADGMPLRMTLDRDLIGSAAADWHIPREVTDGHELLPGSVLLEMKFHVSMPALYRDLLSMLPIGQARASKYRRCVELCGIWDGTRPAAADGSPAAAASAAAAAADLSSTLAGVTSVGVDLPQPAGPADTSAAAATTGSRPAAGGVG